MFKAAAALQRAIYFSPLHVGWVDRRFVPVTIDAGRSSDIRCEPGGGGDRAAVEAIADERGCDYNPFPGVRNAVSDAGGCGIEKARECFLRRSCCLVKAADTLPRSLAEVNVVILGRALTT